LKQGRADQERPGERERQERQGCHAQCQQQQLAQSTPRVGDWTASEERYGAERYPRGRFTCEQMENNRNCRGRGSREEGREEEGHNGLILLEFQGFKVQNP
jgi:hypothetical protein